MNACIKMYLFISADEEETGYVFQEGKKKEYTNKHIIDSIR